MVSQLLRARVNGLNRGSPTRHRSSAPRPGAICPAPANTVDCIPSDGRTHSIGTVRVDPRDGTLWVGSGDGFTENTTFPDRAYDEESMAGKILHIDRDGRGLERAPLLSRRRQPRSRLHQSPRARAFATRSASRCGPAAGWWSATWAGRCARRSTWSTTRAARAMDGPALRAPSRRPGTRPAPSAPAFWSRRPRRSTTTSTSPPTPIVGGPTYTGGSYPPEYVGSIFFGDFTGRFIKRLVPNAGGGFTEQAFATEWGGVALETAPNGDLVSVNPVDFQKSGLGTITRIAYSTPAPAPPPAPVVAPTAIDRTGPRLRLRSIRPRRGRISGTATDSSGVRKVQVAVRRRLPRGGCSWWLRGQRQMSSGRRRCDRPRWMTASLERVKGGVRWSVRLRGQLPPGTFRVLVRATDRKGNILRLAPSRATLVRVKKDRGSRSADAAGACRGNARGRPPLAWAAAIDA